MIKGIFHTNNKNIAAYIIESKNHPFECSIVEYSPITNITDIYTFNKEDFENERRVIYG